MAKRESIQQKIARINPPRVHITYDVQVGSAMVLKELPFVMGVLGDFSGQPLDQLADLADRKFVEITPENFNEVLNKMTPRVTFSVVNKLEGASEPKLQVELKFQELADFDPEQVARQVPELNTQLQRRTKFSDLRASLQGNTKFSNLLREIVENTEKRRGLRAEIEGGEHA